ncbi:hypothetical protein ID866_12487 [Astraeus odoratus]|nr:hypothetical protein ID866_12487 [Astraeus odoratus]
MVSSKNYKAS